LKNAAIHRVPEHRNAQQRHRQTDRQTDRRHYDVNSRSHCVRCKSTIDYDHRAVCGQQSRFYLSCDFTNCNLYSGYTVLEVGFSMF